MNGQLGAVLLLVIFFLPFIVGNLSQGKSIGDAIGYAIFVFCIYVALGYALHTYPVLDENGFHHRSEIQHRLDYHDRRR